MVPLPPLEPGAATRPLDRAAHLRTSDKAATLLADPAARVVPLWRGRVLLRDGEDGRLQPVMLRREALAPLLQGQEAAVFLGHDEAGPQLALALPAGDDTPAHEALRGAGRFQDLRMSGSLLARDDFRLLAYARGMLQWHRRQPRCPRCGDATEVVEAGHVRRCRACDERHFPRTDPAVMALVIHDDRVLLARQPKWPAGFRSVLAGFVEPGETLEQAVAREVREEVGLSVRNVRYLASQPWPFPASLMIGFAMEAEDDRITLGDDELEAAAFYTRAQIREQIEVVVPPRVSLAYRLIQHYLDGAG